MYDIGIIGGGPAGCAAAIYAQRRGARVLLVDASPYPRHKVCGEFVSAESGAVLQSLLGERFSEVAGHIRISTCRLHSDGVSVAFKLAPAAYSFPRFVLDEALWTAARNSGVDCRTLDITQVLHQDGAYTLASSGEHFSAKFVINASGRWSRFSQRPASGTRAFVGLKAHYRCARADAAVELFRIGAGYCGVQPVGDGVLNACALIPYGTANSIDDVLQLHPVLRERARDWQRVTPPFATAPVYLLDPQPVRDGLWHVGDAAGFADPFAGDGISLALRAGALAGSMIGNSDDAAYERDYMRCFGRIFRNTRRLRLVLTSPRTARRLVLRALALPIVGQKLFAMTRQSRPSMHV